MGELANPHINELLGWQELLQSSLQTTILSGLPFILSVATFIVLYKNIDEIQVSQKPQIFSMLY